MGERGTRLAFGAGGLVLLWIAVYWWWGHGDSHHLVSFDTRPPRPVSRDEPASGKSSRESSSPTPVQTWETAPPREIVPPRYRTYIPLDGESWKSIAEEQLGDAALADALRRANPLRSGGELTPGREIRIPIDPLNIQGRPADPPADPTQEEPADDPPPKAERSLQIQEYTIQDMDTLGEISRRFYGTSKHWELIFEHNKTRLNLRGPESIRPGQVLRIPPSPEDR